MFCWFTNWMKAKSPRRRHQIMFLWMGGLLGLAMGILWFFDNQAPSQQIRELILVVYGLLCVPWILASLWVVHNTPPLDQDGYL